MLYGYGYRYSVYARIVRMALHAKGLSYSTDEISPLSRDGMREITLVHPFNRVPVLCHDDFRIYETAAITRFLDVAFSKPALMPGFPKTLARATQLIAIVVHYGYRQMVCQVFSQAVFHPYEPTDRAALAAGLRACRGVLGTLEAIAAVGLVLNGKHTTLADCYLAPMIDYFAMCKERALLLNSHAHLALWWADMALRDILTTIDFSLSKTVTIRT